LRDFIANVTKMHVCPVAGLVMASRRGPSSVQLAVAAN